MTLLDLTGKVILVTGGSRGIGAASARTLARAGAHVLIHYARQAHAAQALVEELGPARATALRADLAQPGSAHDLFAQALAWQGHIDVLVNNAGIFTSASVDDPLAHWHAQWAQTLQVNLTATADLCRAAILHYRTRGGGTIINVASRAAFRGDQPDAMHYAASKGGMVALTRSIARGFAHQGILAYVVAPGWVHTDMADEYIRAHTADIQRDIPIGAPAPPEDIAHTIAFLASGLAPHMTGATLDINGASYVR